MNEEEKTDVTLEALSEQLAAKEETLSSQESRIGELEAQTTQMQDDTARLQAEAEAREGELASLRQQLSHVVERYREAVLEAHPELPQDLVVGATLEEVDASLASARAAMEAIKARLAQQLASEAIPLGAPPRKGPDWSTLSPRDKIARGLTQRG